jgi:hypothetical protein
MLMLDRDMDKLEPDSKHLRRKQAQAMLDLFEADSGRAALTLDEIKEWASAQQEDGLRLRVERLVLQCDENGNAPAGDSAAPGASLPAVNLAGFCEPQ